MVMVKNMLDKKEMKESKTWFERLWAVLLHPDIDKAMADFEAFQERGNKSYQEFRFSKNIVNQLRCVLLVFTLGAFVWLGLTVCSLDVTAGIPALALLGLALCYRTVNQIEDYVNRMEEAVELLGGDVDD
jgi:hypothetical protein